jgi:beta-lactamase class A
VSKFEEKVPQTPAGGQLLWLLDHLAEGAKNLTSQELDKNLAAAFKNQVSPPQLVTGFQQAAQMLSGFTLDEIDEDPEKIKDRQLQVMAILGTPSGDKFRVMIQVEKKAPHLIEGANVVPAPELRAEPAANSWQEFESKFKEIAAKSSFLAGEIVDGQVVPLHAWNEEEPLALGSTFKLYILGELARTIEEGINSWDDQLKIDNKYKNLPSGTMQDEKAGATFSLQDFAEKMISISDNTATDHLLFHLGRENVEKAQELLGHSRPELNTPFFSAKELFQLKLVADEKLLSQVLEADSASRRQLLDEKVAKLKLPKLEALREELEEFGGDPWDTPRHIDRLEWFASATDLANAMAKLKGMSEKPKLGKLKRVLSINPGLFFDKYAWTFIGFKGGSEPGVMNLTWLLQRLDERWFVMNATLNDTQSRIDPLAPMALLVAAAQLLAFHRKKTKAPKANKRK